MEDWGSDGCLRWHFPPLWPLPQAPCHFSPTSCLVVFPLTTMLSWSAQFDDIPEILPLNSHFGITLACWRTRLLWSYRSPHSRASFLSACIQHSGDWLFTLPIASCGLKLDEEAVRVADGLRLGLDLCSPHECRCGSMVDARGLHSFVCKKAPDKIIRHHSLNDLIARSFSAAGVLVVKEPTGLRHSDGKRPDGPSLVPWQNGKQDALLGFDSHLSVSRLIHFSCCSWCRGGSQTCCIAKRSEIRGFRWSIYVCSHCLRELGNTKCYNSPAPFKPWPKIDWHFGRNSRDQLSLSEMFSLGTAL